jgi:large subunit ribosomal protein L25
MSIELKAEKREKFGRGVKALRTAGFVPAELYGKGIENLHLSLPIKDFRKAYKSAGENTIVNITVDGKKYPSLIHDVASDFLSGNPIHVDLYKVDMSEKIQTKVPLEFVGISEAVKSAGGVLVKSVQELPIEAMPDKLPHSIQVDLAKLAEIGSKISVDDLAIPADVKVLVEGKTVVASVIAKITEEQEAALRAESADLSAVKVESEEKKAEREAAKASEAPAEGAPAEAKKQ